MSNEISWPTKPFYIQSKIGYSNWALTTEGTALKMKQLDGGIRFLWKALPDSRGGAILLHVESGKVLYAADGGLSVQDLDPAHPQELFRVEDLGSPWVGINTYLDWEQKINVYESDLNGTVGTYHWDGGADNEEWRLIEETGEVRTESITYDTQHALVDLNLPPAVGASLMEDNTRSGTPLTGSETLSRTLTTSRSITNSTSDTTGRKYTQTFSVKGGVDKVFEVSASASFEESSSTTISYGDQSTVSNTVTDSQTVNINVPAGKKYRYQIVVHYGKCDINYTATMVFQSVVPNSQPYRFTSSGVYTGVNEIASEVVVSDITQGVAGAQIIAQTSLR